MSFAGCRATDSHILPNGHPLKHPGSQYAYWAVLLGLYSHLYLMESSCCSCEISSNSVQTLCFQLYSMHLCSKMWCIHFALCMSIMISFCFVCNKTVSFSLVYNDILCPVRVCNNIILFTCIGSDVTLLFCVSVIILYSLHVSVVMLLCFFVCL